jgi:protein O-mannosyl-transferase
MNSSTLRRAPTLSAPAPSGAARTLWIIRFFLLAVILAAFGRALTNDFVDWDDSQLIYGNPNFNPPTFRGLAHHWNPLSSNNIGMYDPLVYTFWWGVAHGAQLDAPDLLGAKLNPQIFHAANLAVHWLTACLVVEILIRLGIPAWPAAGGAMIFAIHPMQTEAVAWATGMKDLLCGFFCMATIWMHLGGAGKSGRARRNDDLFTAAFYVAALLCKPSAVVLPLIIFMLDVVVLRRPWKKSALAMVPWLLIAAIAAGLASILQPTIYIQAAPLWVRPLIAGDALAFYMAKLLFPVDLAIDYGRTPANLLTNPSFHHALWWTWIFPAAAALLVYHFRQNRRLVAAAWIFVLGLLPVLGLTTFIYQFYSTVADRYIYLSMLGVAIAAGLVLAKLSRPMLAGAITVLSVILISLSFAQAGVWKDSETLYLRDVALNQGNPNHWMILAEYSDREANIMLKLAGDALVGGDRRQSGEYTQNAQALITRAIDSYRHAIQLDPKIQEAYYKLSFDLIMVQRMDEAIDVLKQLVALEPSIPEQARVNPAKLQYTLGMACYNAHRYPEAIEAFQASLQYKDDPDVEKHLQLARTKLQSATRP